MCPRSIVKNVDDWGSGTPSMEVLAAVADLEGDEPEELARTSGVALYDYVDPEALDAILDHCPGITVSFSVDQYDVEVTNCRLSVSEREG